MRRTVRRSRSTVALPPVPRGHFHVDAIDVNDRPALFVTLSLGFLVTFLRLADTIVNVGEVSSTFYFDRNNIAVGLRSYFFTNDDVRIGSDFDRDGAFGSVLDRNPAFLGGIDDGWPDNVLNHIEHNDDTGIAFPDVGATT